MNQKTQIGTYRTAGSTGHAAYDKNGFAWRIPAPADDKLGAPT